ncbi:MAG: hypothetical protein LBB91_09005, partial [Clostridiales bacterium]|nr:hypothetical protein [Clostridiales bacterium]
MGKKLIIILPFAAFIIVALIAIKCCYLFGEISSLTDHIGKLETDIRELELNMQNLQPASSNYAVLSSDSDAKLDFLTNEIKQYRDFVQKENQFLLWLVALIGSLGVGLLGFLGFKSRKDIEGFLATGYSDEFARQLGVKLNDDTDLTYLKKSIAREKQAKEARILFAADKKESDDVIDKLDEIRRFFYIQGYRNVSRHVILLDAASLEREITGY